MAAIAQGTIETPAGMPDIRVTVLTRMDAALRSAGRMFGVGLGAYLVLNQAEIWASIGSNGDRPDIHSLEGLGLGALQAGAIAVGAWALNMARPKTTVAAK